MAAQIACLVASNRRLTDENKMLHREVRACGNRDLEWALAVGKISAALRQGHAAYAQVKAEKILMKMGINQVWLQQQGVESVNPAGSDDE
jgi:hypothetical protein